MASQAEAAEHIGVSPRTFRSLLARGVIARRAARGYDLTEVRLGYIRHLQEVAAGRGARDGTIDLTRERALLAREQREAQALKNRIARGELVEVEAVVLIVSTENAMVRERILAVPGKLSGRLAPADVDAVEDELNEALTELSEPGNVDQIPGWLAGHLRDREGAEPDGGDVA